VGCVQATTAPTAETPRFPTRDRPSRLTRAHTFSYTGIASVLAAADAILLVKGQLQLDRRNDIGGASITSS
jgi:hypothetical protein